MCAIFGFLDYGKKISHKMLTKILREISIAAESRGTDATGISYVRNGKIMTFKKAKPAHKIKLYFPKETTALIGHTRFATQGDEHLNYNNHPFEGETEQHSFALAHNGVLRNDKEIRRKNSLPETKIETDSYIAVQLLEWLNSVDFESLKTVSETVLGSFVFTVLRDDETLFLVKGSNPITLVHFPEYGLYLYASTAEILKTGLKLSGFTAKVVEVKINSGDIVAIDKNGRIMTSHFEETEDPFDYRYWLDWYESPQFQESYKNDLLTYCELYGVTKDEVELLLDYGYDCEEIEEMFFDDDYLQEALAEVKGLYY